MTYTLYDIHLYHNTTVIVSYKNQKKITIYRQPKPIYCLQSWFGRYDTKNVF